MEGKIIYEKRQRDGQLIELIQEVKSNKKALDELQNEVFRQQNKLYLQKTEGDKINKRISVLHLKEERKKKTIRQLDQEIDHQHKILSKLEERYVEVQS